MASNSKLNKAAKQERREMLRDLKARGGETFKFPHYGVVLAVIPSTTTGGAWFAAAVASPDEKKFRAKVGEYLALSRLETGERVYIAGYDPENPDHGARMGAIAGEIAHPEWQYNRNSDGYIYD